MMRQQLQKEFCSRGDAEARRFVSRRTLREPNIIVRIGRKVLRFNFLRASASPRESFFALRAGFAV